MSDYFTHNAGEPKPLGDVVEYAYIGVTEHVTMWTDEHGLPNHSNVFTVGE